MFLSGNVGAGWGIRNGQVLLGNVTFLSPNKKVTKEVGLRGGVRVGVAEETCYRFGNSRRQIHPPLRNLPPWQKIEPCTRIRLVRVTRWLVGVGSRCWVGNSWGGRVRPRPFDFAQGCSGRRINGESLPVFSVILSGASLDAESKNPLHNCPLSIVNCQFDIAAGYGGSKKAPYDYNKIFWGLQWEKR